MLWAREHYRSRSGDGHRPRRYQDRTLTRFVEQVDRLFYAAAAILAACLLGLVAG